MKIMILKDMDDDSVLRILSCADDVDTDALVVTQRLKAMENIFTTKRSDAITASCIKPIR